MGIERERERERRSHTYRQTVWQTKTNRQMHTYIQGNKTHRQRGRQANIHAYRETVMLTGRQ